METKAETLPDNQNFPLDSSGTVKDSSQDSEKAIKLSDESITSDTDRKYLTGVNLVLVLSSMGLIQFLMMLDQTVISTAIPQITNEFKSLLDVGWYGSAYQLASASFQPLTGKIYTNFKVTWAFLAFLFTFELGSLLCGVATSSKMLIVARSVAGLGASGLLNGGMTIFAACMPKERQPAMFGMIVGIGSLGQACGPLIGGALTEYSTWRLCFYINLPLGAIVALVLIFVPIPDNIPKPNRQILLKTIFESLDLLGFAIFAPASIQFFLALQYGGNQYAWNSPTVIGLFCGAGVTFIIFLLWEYHRGENAMIPFSMLRQQTVWATCVTMLFIMGVIVCGGYYLPIYFQAIKGASPMMSGVDVLPNICCQIFMLMVSGILVPKLGYYLPFVLLGTSLLSIGYGLLSMLTPTYSKGLRVLYQIIVGFGGGSAGSMPYVAIQNTVQQAQIPTAMAILVFCQNFGGATFLSMAETVFSNSLRTKVSEYAPDADVEAIVAAGATNFRNVVPTNQLANVIKAYNVSIDHVFYLACGASAAGFCVSWGMGWKDIRKKKVQTEEP